MIAVIHVPILIFFFACIEFFGLIEIGKLIGGGPIFGEILLTGVIGVILLRVSVGKALPGMVISLFAGRFPIRSLLRQRELRLLLAGVLLLIPGVVSDLAGFVLIGRYLIPSRHRPSADENVIDVEYEVHDEQSRK